ncbi:hypothetical protein BRYFOR_05416 [Marvinbryantia formatexigens DSM 14469]|uniref:Uncharacterized protein n=1 Tax=Marvinbryantia formatexigens DSM 14469 TaxID=478749 RepID=C6L9X4_9FIRM|nr:hypothetical protein [Marvinbryantia formatexigens]EET62381.1 hypothetical protein BRYFOR_05416 [Marvinbryantia formatexigens DSM 14469]UWO25073.1 hypothetical protein NQ534_00815 [Marvinbryantia formatexigens DSM 14469]
MKQDNRDIAIKKITEMSQERVSKVLIFMAGMEAEHVIEKQDEMGQSSKIAQ